MRFAFRRWLGTAVTGLVVGAASVAGAFPVDRGEIVFDVENGIFFGAYHPDDFESAEVRAVLRRFCTEDALHAFKENRGSKGFLVVAGSCKDQKTTVPDGTRLKARRSKERIVLKQVRPLPRRKN